MFNKVFQEPFSSVSLKWFLYFGWFVTHWFFYAGLFCTEHEYSISVIILAMFSLSIFILCFVFCVNRIMYVYYIYCISLYRAFCDNCNTLRLKHFFSFTFEYILGTKSIFSGTNKTVDRLDGFLNCIEGARYVDLPVESKV